MEKEIYKIPIKYKENLEQRSDERNAIRKEDKFVIPVKCQPCYDAEKRCDNCIFHKNPMQENCMDILFNILKNSEFAFIQNVIFISHKYISWSVEHDRVARQMLKKLRNKAEKRIEFVKGEEQDVD